MQINQRARSSSAKLEREDDILTAAEILLRQLGYSAMTMQAVATASGLGKGTLYLYFPSREALVIGIYNRLFDQWIGRFASHQPEVSGFEGFCRDFSYYYVDDPLFLQLTGLAIPLMEPSLDRDTYINGKRAMISRVKKLAGIACHRLGMTPSSAQRLVWALLTIASGAIQISCRPMVPITDLPKDIVAFVSATSFETVFLNAAKPFWENMTPH